MLSLYRRLAVLATIACLPLASACATGIGDLPPLEGAGTAEVRVAPGDKVRIAVQDLDAIAGDYTIDETGFISVPFVRQIKVAGLSYPEVENTIAKRLIEMEIIKNPSVTVQPLELRPIYVMGEVRQPGEYAYRQGMTVFAAISMAGGYTYRAETGRVAVTRFVGDRAVTGTATDDTPILPGDRIRIYESWF